MDKPTDIAAYIRARSTYLNETRAIELRERGDAEVIASIFAVDGFVALTASTQPERLTSGLSEQQRLFRKFKFAK
jgi:hypothetical protein